MRSFALVVAAACLFISIPLGARAGDTPALRIAFVPLDDRPATEQFGRQIAAICGVAIETPPQETLGHFERPGDPGAIARWLTDLNDKGLTALVVSTDMLAYGGLVASRTASTSLGDALYRLRPLDDFHRLHPGVPIYAFGTVMRLAPTATPASEPYLDALTHYAQLAGVPAPTHDQRAALAISRSNIPGAVFWDYLGSRARDLDVDESLLARVTSGDVRLLSLTQDDAGSPTGLQVPEQAHLRALVDRMEMGSRVFLNPGTDEMGAVMIVRAIEDAVSWSPSVSIVYPSEAAASASDPLEYLPIRSTVANLAAFLKMRAGGDFELAVNAPDPDPAVQEAFLNGAIERLRSGAPTAIADLSFLTDDLIRQRAVFDGLEAADVAAAPIAFASWNTTANSAGTALAESAATLIGRHLDTFDPDAAATFLFDRYVDDIGYRVLVREPLQAQLRAGGADVYALGDQAVSAESTARAMLWPVALSIFDRDFAPRGFRANAISIYLPWQRTFEVRLAASLTSP